MHKSLESREDFVARLHTCVRWLNTNHAASLERYARNQKERARECLNAEPPGSRTKW